MAEKEEKCYKCGKETGVYTMVTMYHCENCRHYICADCLPPECVKGKIFKKQFCPGCDQKMKYVDVV